MCLKTYLNHPINQKTSQKKQPKGDHSFQKKGGGGVRRGMIMITDSMGFFFGTLPKLLLTFHFNIRNGFNNDSIRGFKCALEQQWAGI